MKNATLVLYLNKSKSKDSQNDIWGYINLPEEFIEELIEERKLKKLERSRSFNRFRCVAKWGSATPTPQGQYICASGEIESPREARRRRGHHPDKTM